MQQQNTQNQPQKEMTTQVITLYCLCDDFLRARRWRDDPQAQMSTAEVMTVSLVAAALFDGNHEKSRRFLQEHGYIKTMLSKGRFNRRWHVQPPLARSPRSALAGPALAAGGSRQSRQPGGRLCRRQRARSGLRHHSHPPLPPVPLLEQRQEPTQRQPKDGPESRLADPSEIPGAVVVSRMSSETVHSILSEAKQSVKRRREVVSVYAQKIGDRIRLRRRGLGWRQGKPAAELGVSQDSVSRYEAGITDLTASELPRIAETLRVPVAYFFEPFSYSSSQGLAEMMFGPSRSSEILSEAELADMRRSVTTETETMRYFQTLEEPFRSVLLSNAKALYELQMEVRRGSAETDDDVAAQSPVTQNESAG